MPASPKLYVDDNEYEANPAWCILGLGTDGLENKQTLSRLQPRITRQAPATLMLLGLCPVEAIDQRKSGNHERGQGHLRRITTTMAVWPTRW